MVKTAENWKDFACIDAGDGEKLERWQNIVLRRPDPQAIWPKDKNEKLWKTFILTKMKKLKTLVNQAVYGL